MPKRIRDRVLTYITRSDYLLVFRHTQYPEAGIQVPGGGVEPGETFDAAALREAEEESGLSGFEIVRYLGTRDYDLTPWGRDEIERRHFYHLRFTGETPVTWLNYENAASDGSEPYEFEFWWAKFPDEVPELIGGQGDLLSEVKLDYLKGHH